MNSACVPESTRSLRCTFQMFHIKNDDDDSFVHDKMQIKKSRFPNYNTEFNNYSINMSNNTDINKTISFVMRRDFVLHYKYIIRDVYYNCKSYKFSSTSAITNCCSNISQLNIMY